MIGAFQRNKTLLFLLIILGIAVFFRLWQIDSIPPGLYPDEAINGNDAISALKTGNFKVFYPDNNGREGLFINLIALSFGIFSISIWSLKIVGALIGIFTVLGLYLLTRELFNKNVALLSSFFLAISFWHINFSRIGFRGILAPFILVFAFYFLLRGFKTKNVWNFIISGIFFGLGFYTYISFRAAVLILIVVLILKLIEYFSQNLPQKKWEWFWNKMYIQDGWWKVGLFLLVIILVAIPIGVYFLQNPGDFISRATGVSIFSAQNPIKAFGESLILHLGMFNFYGDSNWRHNFSGSPMLFWPIGILFWIGFILIVKDLVKSIKNKNFVSHQLLVASFLISWFCIMILPGILTYEGIPHALRVIGVIPVVYIFVGLGGWYVYKWFDQNIRSKKLLVLTSLFFLFAMGFLQFDKYFIKWGGHSEVEGAFSKNYVEIGNYLNSLPAEAQKYVIVNEMGVPLYGISIPAQTPIFIEIVKFGQPRSTYLRAEDLNQIKTDQREIVIVPLYDGRLLDKLNQKFPQGQIKREKGFWVYEIR